MSQPVKWIKPTEYTQGIFNDEVVCETTLRSPAGVRYDLTIVRAGSKYQPIHGMERMTPTRLLRDAKIDLLNWYHMRLQTDEPRR